eukprot:TRINITY_DN15313_c0_g1_i3.p1 TRINITY_DN15313_c0_g1~~TRINITY_DN15313_c0_g1_i3.p1  ORF type:complete len:296 (-),score=83.17 TRINITY_DN15313_c0_g1_i3:86-973(-)
MLRSLVGSEMCIRDRNYIIFSCNLLVYKTKHCFNIKDVTRLTKSRHAGVNPGFSIHFQDPKDKVSFFSFFDRDKAILLINKLSQTARGEDQPDQDEDQEEFDYQEVVASISAEGESAFPEIFPAIPEDDPVHAHEIFSCEFPMTTREAFVLLYTNQSKFTEKSKLHEASSEISISPWSPSMEGKDSGWVRELSFRYPLDGIPMCPPSTMVHEVQQARLCAESDRLVISYSVQSLDVPYGTYFTVETKHVFSPILKETPNPNPNPCLLYTSDAADEEDSVDLGGRRIIKKKKKKKK